MKKLILLSLFLGVAGWGLAQSASFKVQLSTDSLLLGNYTEVSFTLENANGRNFQAPSFEGFQIVGGPNQSSSFSMVNGAVSQSLSYTYYIEPLEIGNYYIEPASIETDEGILETQPIEVIVVPNPDGIQQRPERKSRSLDLFKPLTPVEPTPKKPRKKRRIYRI